MIKIAEGFLKQRCISQIQLLVRNTIRGQQFKGKNDHYYLINNSSQGHFSTIQSPKNVQIVDKDKLIRSLEEGLSKVSDPKTGLENVDLLIKLKSQQNKGEVNYTGYEKDLFSRASALFSVRDYKTCSETIEIICKSTSPYLNETKGRALLLKASLVQHTTGNSTQALAIAKEALKQIENEGSLKELKANIYHFAGELLWSVFRNSQEGQEYLDKAIVIIQEELSDNYLLDDQAKGGLMQRLANCYDSLAEISESQQDSKKSDDLMSKCMDLWQENKFKQPFQYANSLLKQGKILCERGELAKSLEKFARGAKLMQGFENTDQFIVLCIWQSKARRGQERFDSALEALEEGFSQLKHLEAEDQIKVYYNELLIEEKVEVLLGKGDFEGALNEVRTFKEQSKLRQTIMSDIKYEVLKQEVVILVVLGRYNDIHNVVEELSIGCSELYGAESKQIAELFVAEAIATLNLQQNKAGIEMLIKATRILQKQPGNSAVNEIQEVWNQAVQILQEFNDHQATLTALKELKSALIASAQKSGGDASLAVEYIDQQINETKKQIK